LSFWHVPFGIWHLALVASLPPGGGRQRGVEISVPKPHWGLHNMIIIIFLSLCQNTHFTTTGEKIQTPSDPPISAPRRTIRTKNFTPYLRPYSSVAPKFHPHRHGASVRKCNWTQTGQYSTLTLYSKWPSINVSVLTPFEKGAPQVWPAHQAGSVRDHFFCFFFIAL
jgi:hypothetical protein